MSDKLKIMPSKEDIEEMVKHLPYPRRFVEEWEKQRSETYEVNDVDEHYYNKPHTVEDM